MSEFKITLIVSRYGHYRAIAIAEQHIIRHPHWQDLTIEWIDDKAACRQAFFLHRGHVGFGHRACFAFGNKGLQFGIVFGRGGCQWVLGGHSHIGCAHQSVWTGGVDLQVLVPAFWQIGFAVFCHGKAHLHAA